MSYDLTVRADSEYSRSTNVSRVIDFVRQLPNLQWNERRQFVLDDPPSRYMEINLEFATPDGDFDEALTESGPDVNCVRMHVPYAFLEANLEQDYLPTAFAIAEFLGWQLHDEQSGSDLSR